jgi:Phytanoyl-CoA dioxygenase (PhyH)
MDHLQSIEERQARWYSDLWPTFVPVQHASDWNDLLKVSSADNSTNEEYKVVYSLPMVWLQQPQNSTVPGDIIAKVLETHGFIVISGVLHENECHHALDLAWDWIEATSASEQAREVARKPTSAIDKAPVQRLDTSSHASAFFPRAVEGGMMPFYGSGHSSFAWKIRSHPNVKQVFASLYGTSDLISSLDCIVLWRAGREHCTADRGWFHLDQNPRHKPNRECVQGLVNLLPVTPETGGNAIVARSHQYFPHHYCEPEDNANDSASISCCSDFYRVRLDELGEDDWMEIDRYDTDVLDPSKIISLQMQAGDLLLWDSRVAHCSYPAKEDSAGSASSTDGLIRAAVAVSMMPTSRATSSTLLERKNAVHASRTLTHWANKVHMTHTMPDWRDRVWHLLWNGSAIDGEFY